jgi:hypothetical protein
MAPLVANVIVLAVRADISIVPMFQLSLNVVVAPDAGLADPNTAVSCANGKLFAAGVPPKLVAHAVADQLLLPARFQYTVLAAGNVIPLLPLQSPNLVPDAGAAAPAMVMSRKSASVAEKAAQVSVRVVPIVSERTKCRIVALVPAESVSVPLMV